MKFGERVGTMTMILEGKVQWLSHIEEESRSHRSNHVIIEAVNDYSANFTESRCRF